MHPSIVVLTFAVALLVPTPILAAVYCPPDACDRIVCEEIDEVECRLRSIGYYEFLPHGGLCGCCGICVQVIQAGSTCIDALVTGAIPRAICIKGTYCDNVTHKCKRKSN